MINARLLMLLEEGSWLAMPLIDGLLFNVTDEFKIIVVMVVGK